jgi:hypothetical protein
VFEFLSELDIDTIIAANKMDVSQLAVLVRSRLHRIGRDNLFGQFRMV